MYRNISSRYTLCRRNQENQLMVFVPRLESNRWWIYLSFQSSTFRPFRAFSPSKRSKVTIVIQPIHDSRFTIRPSTLFFFHRSIQQRYTISSFLLLFFRVESGSSSFAFAPPLVPSKRRSLRCSASMWATDRVYTGNLWREYRDFAADNRRSVISAAISRVVRPRGRNAPYDSLLIPVPLRLSKIDRRSYRRIVARPIMLLSFRFEVWMLRVHRWTGNVFSRIFISGERLRIGDIHVRGATDLFKLRVRGKKKNCCIIYRSMQMMGHDVGLRHFPVKWMK